MRQDKAHELGTAVSVMTGLVTGAAAGVVGLVNSTLFDLSAQNGSPFWARVLYVVVPLAQYGVFYVVGRLIWRLRPSRMWFLLSAFVQSVFMSLIVASQGVFYERATPILCVVVVTLARPLDSVEDDKKETRFR